MYRVPKIKGEKRSMILGGPKHIWLIAPFLGTLYVNCLMYIQSAESVQFCSLKSQTLTWTGKLSEALLDI